MVGDDCEACATIVSEVKKLLLSVFSWGYAYNTQVDW